MIRELSSRALAVCLALTLCAGCGVIGAVRSMDTGEVLRGTVLDESTGQPIAGAWIAAVYTSEGGAFAGHSSTACYRFEAKQSGPDGTYEFPLDGRGQPDVRVVYKAGYSRGHNPLVVRKEFGPEGRNFVWWVIRMDWATGQIVRKEQAYPTEAEARTAAHATDIYLKPFVGTREQRFEELWRVAVNTMCSEANKRRKGESEFLEAVRAEMVGLATSAKDRNLIESVEEMIRMAR